jgi:hypothetical protein
MWAKRGRVSLIASHLSPAGLSRWQARKKAESRVGFVDSQSWISRCQSFQERIYVYLHRMTFNAEESIRNGRKPAKKDLQVVVESWTTMFQLSPSLRTPRLLSRIAALQNGRTLED